MKTKIILAVLAAILMSAMASATASTWTTSSKTVTTVFTSRRSASEVLEVTNQVKIIQDLRKSISKDLKEFRKKHAGSAVVLIDESRITSGYIRVCKTSYKIYKFVDVFGYDAPYSANYMKEGSRQTIVLNNDADTYYTLNDALLTRIVY